MSYIVYMSDYPIAFQHAHNSLWLDKQTNVLEVEDQIKGWKEKHHANIFGGAYDNGINYRAVSVEFEDEAAFMLFLLKWS